MPSDTETEGQEKKKRRGSIRATGGMMSTMRQTALQASREGIVVDLDSVRPDPSQARSVLPTKIAEKLAQGKILPSEALDLWIRLSEDDDAPKVIKGELEQTRELARNIRSQGLINSIEVRSPFQGEFKPKDVSYFIATGERRYWALMILNATGLKVRHKGDMIDPLRIPVELLSEAEAADIRVRQYSENTNRSDYNAVERAIALLAIRYEKSGFRYGTDNPNDTELIPWKDVEDDPAVGIGKRTRIQLTNVLNLSKEAQEIIIDYDLPERAIRPIVSKLQDHPNLQIPALQELTNSREKGTSIDIELFIDQLLSGSVPTTTGSPVQSRTKPIDVKFVRKAIGGTMKKFGEDGTNQRIEFVKSVKNSPEKDEIIAELKSLEKQISGLLKEIR